MTEKKGELYKKQFSLYQLCSPSPDKIEKCPTRRWHGCGGDGDDVNCMTIKYVKVEVLEKAKADFPTAEKLIAEVKARKGKDYYPPSGEELMEALNEERDKWYVKWFGET